MLIFDKLHNDTFFLTSKIQRIPYVFNNLQHFNVNFNPKTNSFEGFNLHQIEIAAFSSIRLDFKFVFSVDQLVIYTEGTSIPYLASNVPIQNPPVYKFREIVLHNMGQSRLSIAPITLVGQLEIHNLQHQHTYLPVSVRNEAFQNFSEHTEELQKYNILFELSERISNLLNVRNSQYHQDELNKLHTNVHARSM